MRVDIPLFKIVERPLLPISGSWVDAAPFVIFFVILAAAAALLQRSRHAQFWRRCCQALSAFVFVIFLHRCLCMLRSWIFALRLVGRNDIVAFGHLCMFALLVSVTLVVGRVFCGWVCPMGLFGEITAVLARRRARLPRGQRLLAGYLLLTGVCILIFWFAYMVRPGTHFFSENVAAIWVAFLLLFLFVALPVEDSDRGLKRIKYLSMALWLLLSIIGVFVTSPWCVLFGDEVDYSSLTALAGVLFAGSIVSMAWCRYVCPMGAALGWLAKHSPVKIAPCASCTQCGTCASLCPMGAVRDGSIDQSSCIYCGRCQQVEDFSLKTDNATDRDAEAAGAACPGAEA